MDKRAVRARMRGIRGGLSGQPIAVPPQLHARFISASYIPIAGEIDPAPLVDAACAAGCRIALPHVVDKPTPIRFLSSDGPLVAGPFGLTQPPEDAEPLDPWNRPYFYRSPSSRPGHDFDLCSRGPNNQAGESEADLICNP